MNHKYLIKYISYNLHTIVRQFQKDYKLMDRFCGCPDYSDDIYYGEIMRYILANHQESIVPLLLSLNNQIAYAFIPAPDFSFMIGPVNFEEPIYLNHVLATDSVTDDFVQNTSVCDFTSFVKDTLLLYNLYQEQEYPDSSLLLENCLHTDTSHEIQKHFSNLVFQNMEHGKVHNPYDQEVREFDSIERGDIEQLKRSLQEDYPGEIGTLARDPLRQNKNRGIVVVTLASRAAMRGGVLPELAYSLSDSYIQKIEESREVPTIFHLFHSAEFEYAQLVKDLREQRSENTTSVVNQYIMKCKDYIYSHLHDKISVADIAAELNINTNYLSTLFREHENQSITDFIQKSKIDLAKNLLVYSQYSYIEIATYLGFSSQSHLGKYFKKLTGYTLKKYRELYGVKGFID